MVFNLVVYDETTSSFKNKLYTMILKFGGLIYCFLISYKSIIYYFSFKNETLNTLYKKCFYIIHLNILS